MKAIKNFAIYVFLILFLVPAMARAQAAPCTENGNHVTCYAPGTNGNFTVVTNGAVRKQFTYDGYEITPTLATSLTAAGTTTTDALVLTAPVNVVSTVAAGSGVRLPTAKTGMVIEVVNRGANAVIVYPDTGGTIDGGSTDGAFYLAVSMSARFTATALLTWQSNISSSALTPYAATVSAAGTNSQANSTLLASRLNVVTTAAASSGVRLPVGKPGQELRVFNRGANPLQVFPETGGAIDGLAANASVYVDPGEALVVDCVAALTWVTRYTRGSILQPFNTTLSAAGTNSQANSTLLAAYVNNVTTAAASSGVRLPASNAGVEIIVFNHGVAPLQIFPATGGTIDGGAANASIYIVPNDFARLYSTAADTWQSTQTNTATLTPITTGITAAGANSQAGSTLITSKVNVVTTAAATTGVRLPVGVPGMMIYISNQGANTMHVYPETGGTIDAASANAAADLATTKKGLYFCTALLTWVTILSA